jgi:hypothetical protein
MVVARHFRGPHAVVHDLIATPVDRSGTPVSPLVVSQPGQDRVATANAPER